METGNRSTVEQLLATPLASYTVVASADDFYVAVDDVRPTSVNEITVDAAGCPVFHCGPDAVVGHPLAPALEELMRAVPAVLLVQFEGGRVVDYKNVPRVGSNGGVA